MQTLIQSEFHLVYHHDAVNQLANWGMSLFQVAWKSKMAVWMSLNHIVLISSLIKQQFTAIITK